jgi:ElaB/YqjD/DUF883 family membrane-anchored ribosome-binding protein
LLRLFKLLSSFSQVTSLEAELRAATAASAEAEQSHAEALKTATISAEAQITAMTQKHAEAIHTSQQEVDALAQEVTALKSSEAAALDEMRDTQVWCGIGVSVCTCIRVLHAYINGGAHREQTENKSIYTPKLQ